MVGRRHYSCPKERQSVPRPTLPNERVRVLTSPSWDVEPVDGYYHCVCNTRQVRRKTSYDYCPSLPYLTLPYLNLPYNTGNTFYRLALRPLTGPMRITELTVRLQNPQVQYSPGSIPIPGTIPLPRGGLLT